MDKVVLRTTFIDIRAKRTRFLSENNVSGRYRSDPPLLSLFRRYFLASPRTNAVCTTTLVTRDIDTRVVARPGRGGKRSPRCVWGGGRGWNRWSTLSRANIFFFPFPFSPFPSYARRYFLTPRLPFVLRLLSASIFSSPPLFFFSYSYCFWYTSTFVYSWPKEKQEWEITKFTRFKIGRTERNCSEFHWFEIFFPFLEIILFAHVFVEETIHVS